MMFPAAVRPSDAPAPDFAADPEAAPAEAWRLSYGHMANPAFATETSLNDSPPHRRIAVYERMREQSPLRFLPADDADAGKTIMTGLYAREMLSRRLTRRVLVVPPAGPVGNWRCEKQDLLRLRFRIASGADARARNPFAGPESDPIIVGIDTLAGERMFERLREDATEPCDLTVFDEAHKLSADRGPDFRVRKTGRYRPAQTIPAARFPGRTGICCCSPQPAILILAWSDAADRSRRSQEGMSTAIMRTAAPRAAYGQGRSPVLSVAAVAARCPVDPGCFRRFSPQRDCATMGYGLSPGPDGERALCDSFRNGH